VSQIKDSVWLESAAASGTSKARIRQLTYKALIDYIDRQQRDEP
jgi:hypothetical protein